LLITGKQLQLHRYKNPDRINFIAYKVTHIRFKYLLINRQNISVGADHYEGANMYWTISILAQEQVVLIRHYGRMGSTLVTY